MQCLFCLLIVIKQRYRQTINLDSKYAANTKSNIYISLLLVLGEKENLCYPCTEVNGWQF